MQLRIFPFFACILALAGPVVAPRFVAAQDSVLSNQASPTKDKSTNARSTDASKEAPTAPQRSQQQPPRDDIQGGGQGRGMGRGAGRGMGRGQGRGMGPGGGMGRRAAEGAGHAGDERHTADQEVFHFLLENHDKIRRTVKELPDGVETLTESDVPEIAAKIQEHVVWMEHRVENTLPIRMRDPLFAEIFQHTDKISMVHEETDKGVKVTETSDDPYVVSLIQAHARVVSGFVARGFTEAMKNHPIPSGEQDTEFTTIHPVIAEVGGVVKLPSAAQQPRAGTKLVVDLTRGGEASQLNNAIEKVAKYVNIYAGIGAEPVQAKIAVVFHGDATLVVLNDDAYGAEFKTQGNPNLALLRQLHEAGVELYVCGQSLISKGHKPDEVAVFIDTAASALTAVVNFQSDGYTYIPLGK